MSPDDVGNPARSGKIVEETAFSENAAEMAHEIFEATPPITPRGSECMSGASSSETAGVVDKLGADMNFKQVKDEYSSKEDKTSDLHKTDSTQAKPKAERDADDPYKNLSPHETAILKRQVETSDVKVGLWSLYRYSSRTDIFLLFLGTFASIAAGALLPCMPVIFGNLQGTLADFSNGTQSRDDFESELGRLVLWFIYLAIAMFVSQYITTVAFIYTGESISNRIREHYLQSCLKQNIGFFDNLGSGEIVTRITADANLIQDGISEKVSLTITAISTFFTAYIIGFILCWKLTLIMISTVVAFVLVIMGSSKFIVKNARANIMAYAVGGTVAEEALSSIRNSVAFGTQDRLAVSYDTHLAKAKHYGIRLKVFIAILSAALTLIMNWNYGLGFWQGSVFLINGEVSLSRVLTVIMCIFTGSFAIGNVTPNKQAFVTAVGAASKIYTTIDRVSALDSLSSEGAKLDKVEGEIELRNVRMIYPSRPEVTVMDNFSLKIPVGKTTALVGASGCGKSTIIGLVERFYKPVRGEIYLDGYDIASLNLRWLRQQISLVSQEPVLFGTTVYDNIRYGLVGTAYEHAGHDKQKELIEAAAVKAYAHDFITALPEGYQTNVGERGFLFSGGQKQRIAIARAICSDPKILLLDEATSALDSRSEGIVQAALDQASAGRTTIAIAHRLSTIKDADNIVVMSEGQIVEQGTHNELLKKQGAYYSLVTAQAIVSVNHQEGATPAEKDEVELLRQMPNKERHVTAVASQGSDFDPNVEKLVSTLTRQSTSKSLSESEADSKCSLWTLLKFLGSFNKEEWPLMVVGLFFATLSGLATPSMSYFFAQIIVHLSIPVTPENIPEIRSSASFWCLMFLMLGIAQLITFVIQGTIFALGSERMIHRIRNSAFRAMLRQDIAFFDRDENTAGALTSFLSTQTTQMAGLSGATLGIVLMSISTLVACCIITLAIGWKLALVCIATVPILLACGFLRVWVLAKLQGRAQRAYNKSALFASEAVTAIRTVASLTREHDILQLYRDSLATQLRNSTKSILRSSSLYAASQSILFFTFALGFWYGGRLMARGEYSMFQFFVVFSEIIYGAQSAGAVFSFAPDIGKCKNAATALKTLFDRQPIIDSWSTGGTPLLRGDKSAVHGTVEFRDVHFHYPMRPNVPVLRGLSLQVQPGQYIALVGPSGCGKSTTIALLERFYNPVLGSIFVDGREISSLNVNDYRSFLALVSQEPTLYAGTIRDNILLGVTDPSSISEQQIENVCREANIYNFIISLPDGFATMVGSKGTLLSGGQKQRIVIARALIRNPKILLLDEATSALDSESEHVVQVALDRAAKGRTTIAVAHRLSTIAKADCIYVFEKGVIVEKGTHRELMELSGGRYAELVRLQKLDNS